MSSHSDDSDCSDDETYVPPNEEDESPDEESATNEQNGTDETKISNTEVDRIWNDFKSNVQSDKKEKSVLNGAKDARPDETSESEKSGTKKDTVTVTKVYDFAGEEVRISKEVSKDSKEAQIQLKAKNISTSQSSLPALGRGKRASGLMGVLGKLNKKPKLSTLEKSKLDWQNYKEEEGIQDELKSHNKGKDGYLEKKFFLERTDIRQFEKERDIRLARSSKR